MGSIVEISGNLSSRPVEKQSDSGEVGCEKDVQKISFMGVEKFNRALLRPEDSEEEVHNFMGMMLDRMARSDGKSNIINLSTAAELRGIRGV